MPLALRLQVANWQAEKGGKLKFSLPFEKDGRVSLHLIAVHRPGGAVVQVSLDGKPLTTARREEGANEIPLRSALCPPRFEREFSTGGSESRERTKSSWSASNPAR